MKQILLFTVIIAFLSCDSNNLSNIETDLDLTGYESSKLDGSASIYVFKKDENGNFLEEGFIKNGIKDGQWISYDPLKGHISTISSYIDGQLNGYSFKVSDRGYLDEQIGYKSNELNGKYFQYRYGRPKFEAFYVNGKLDGVQKEYYDNGKLQQETGFKGGVQDGLYNYYSDDGILRMSYTYKNGEKISGGIVENVEEETD